MSKRTARFFVALAVSVFGFASVVGLAIYVVGNGYTGELHGRGTPSSASIDRTQLDERANVRAEAGRALASGGDDEVDELERQILFGDLHVHTTFSSDAYLFSLPIIQGEGVHPPADACDFARFCSGLDFYSINDHAELLSSRQWRETQESIRECNVLSGDSSNPDLVAFLGWEWTDMAPLDPGQHFGHKNVLVLGTEDGEVPVRPIAARSTAMDQLITQMGAIGGSLIGLPDFPELKPYLDFNRYRREAAGLERCAEGIDVRDLPSDCLEVAETPAVLFEKLDQWGFPSLVIPHGTAWGIHAPRNSSLATQLPGELHDPSRQRLFEVYSGHGNSELYRNWRHGVTDDAGSAICPEPSDGFTPCCWRAGELIRDRCSDASSQTCEERVASAKDNFLAAGIDPRRYGVVPGSTPEDWLDCGTMPDGFLDAYIYRPMMSAQYGLAVGAFDEDGEPARFRYGFIGSSDNHKARAGTGYKEFGRKAMADGWGFRNDVLQLVEGEPEQGADPIVFDSVPPGSLLSAERGASFYYTGGLVAVHAEGRAREKIWNSLEQREVYGTSGDRILLWFNLIDGARDAERRHPMGSEVSIDGVPRFEVRAAGALEQLPGCPAGIEDQLTPERLQRLCLGECYNPGDQRKTITRIEVVRIRPQLSPDESIEPLIEDPWRVFACPADPAGCRVEFEDSDFPGADRETVYYVRAIQEPSLAVGGDPLRCERDAAGRCIKTRPCFASGSQFDPSDECLAPIEERAWSSPIFLQPL
jgi:hypothetical protein